MVFGKPLLALITGERPPPFQIGGCDGSGDVASLGDHTDKTKVLERVILPAKPGLYRHWWGEAEVPVGIGVSEQAVCLAKGKFRARIEGWEGMSVREASDWERKPVSDCFRARHEISVWEPCEIQIRRSYYGPVREASELGLEEIFWIEYAGPLTGGVCRRAGPFG
jgi:hypothetical protein